MAKDFGRDVIAVSVLFDLMDRIRECGFLRSEANWVMRVTLQWATDNGLLREPAPADTYQVGTTYASPRDFVFVGDDPRVRPADPAPMRGEYEDRAEDAGPSVDQPEPSVGTHADEEPPAPASAAADGAGGSWAPPASEDVSPGAPAPSLPGDIAAEVPPDASAAPVQQATGPLTEAEKKAIRISVELGMDATAIAGLLNRRVQTVALYISRHLAAKSTEIPSGQPVPAHQAGEDPAPEAPASPADEGPEPVAQVLPEEAPVAGGAPNVAPAAAPFSNAPRPAWWREIEAVLNALGHKAPWTPELDLALVQGLTSGTPIEVLADELGVERAAIRARFVAMTPGCVDRRGARSVSFEAQQHLIEVLRDRAGAV